MAMPGGRCRDSKASPVALSETLLQSIRLCTSCPPPGARPASQTDSLLLLLRVAPPSRGPARPGEAYQSCAEAGRDRVSSSQNYFWLVLRLSGRSKEKAAWLNLASMAVGSSDISLIPSMRAGLGQIPAAAYQDWLCAPCYVWGKCDG